MSTFTPGPWALREVGDLDIAYSVDAGRNAIADVYNHADEWEANARLIAAAPCMAAFVQKHAEAGDAEAIALWERINGRA